MIYNNLGWTSVPAVEGFRGIPLGDPERNQAKYYQLEMARVQGSSNCGESTDCGRQLCIGEGRNPSEPKKRHDSDRACSFVGQQLKGPANSSLNLVDVSNSCRDSFVT
jgi:hypothetical protein